MVQNNSEETDVTSQKGDETIRVKMDAFASSRKREAVEWRDGYAMSAIAEVQLVINLLSFFRNPHHRCRHRFRK